MMFATLFTTHKLQNRPSKVNGCDPCTLPKDSFTW